jgi:phosphate/sulfate permease
LLPYLYKKAEQLKGEDIMNTMLGWVISSIIAAVLSIVYVGVIASLNKKVVRKAA